MTAEMIDGKRNRGEQRGKVLIGWTKWLGVHERRMHWPLGARGDRNALEAHGRLH